MKGLAQKVWRQCVFAHDLGYREGNCNGLLANTGLFFPLVTDTFSSFNTDDSVSTIYHGSCFNSPNACRQSFVNGVPDLYFSLPWFSTIDSWEPKSSDEYSCRTIPMRL